MKKKEYSEKSELDDRHLTARLREVAIEQLKQAPEEEVWLIADGSDLRKPYAEEMPYLMQVRDLDGHLVPGYRTINVIGVTPGRRGLLYHHLFSSQAPDDVERADGGPRGSTDGEPSSHPAQEAQDHLVCRLYHLDRLVSFEDRQGQWQQGNLEQARGQMRPMARVQTTLVAGRR